MIQEMNFLSNYLRTSNLKLEEASHNAIST